MTRTRVCFCILGVVFALTASAQSANGDFRFDYPGATGAVQFHARAFGDSARGEISFASTQDVSNDAVDDTGGPGATPTSVTLTVSIDCLRQSGRRASMSGLVTASSIAAYNGRRAILTVEDNGEGVNAVRDAFTWGLYDNTLPTWTPSDAEVPGDNGAMFSWTATDFERPDDVGIPAGAGAPAGIDCRSFGLDAYSLQTLEHGSGNIQVRN